MSKESSKKLMELYLHNLCTCFKIIDALIPVVKTFESKVYTKRFDNALKSIGDKYNVSVIIENFDYKSCQIDFGFYASASRCIQEKEGFYYLPKSYERINIVYIYSDFNTWTTDRKTNEKYYSPSSEHHFYIDENYKIRIGSDKIIKKLQEKKNYLEGKIKTLKEKVNNLEKYEARLKEIKAELKVISDDVPSEITDFFNLNIPSYF